MANKLNESETKRLKELIALKKANKLTDSDAKELEELNKKCGFKGPKRNKDGEEFKPGNDFSWWNKCPELLKDAANFKCNYIAGEVLDVGKFPYVVPGVLKVNVTPTYGHSQSPTDPLNVWARDLYLRMFQKYRPASGYSAADLGITLIAAIEFIKIVAVYERIYGIINRYSKLNTNMPYVEEEALGITHAQADYLRGHLSDFRFDINELIRRAQRICIPKDIALLANAISLYGCEYLDHESPRSQMIIFQTTHFGFYDETDLSAGNVKFEAVDYTQLFDFSRDNMCVYLEDAVNALVGSDSVQKIFADLVVWFKEESMLQIHSLPEEYMVIPVKSESILHKLHNAEACFFANAEPKSGAVSFASAADQAVILQSYRIYQANDVIVSAFSMVPGTGTLATVTLNGVDYQGSATACCDGYFTDHILDAYRAELDPETVTEGSLWKASFTVADSTGGVKAYYNINCGFEMIRGFELYQNGALSNPVYSKVNIDNVRAQAAAFSGNLSLIDWAPLSYLVRTGTNIFDEIYGDMDNVTPMSAQALGKVLRSVIYSGLNTDVTPKVS